MGRCVGTGRDVAGYGGAQEYRRADSHNLFHASPPIPARVEPEANVRVAALAASSAAAYSATSVSTSCKAALEKVFSRELVRLSKSLKRCARASRRSA